MPYTLEMCEQFWDEAGQHGAPQERLARARRWLPYYAYIAEGQKSAPFSMREDKDSFIARLCKDALLTAEDSVLDIGAGTGGNALELAHHCKSVTALELCPEALDVLRAHADACGVGNITAVNGSWEEFEPNGRFDVTFSSLCPAICNMDELRRMESIANRRCVLVTVMRGSYDKHRRAMMAELGLKPRGMVTEAIHYYNALYLMGRQPEVFCRTQRSEYDIPVEKIMEQYPIYFEIFGVERSASLPFLREYCDKYAENDVLREESCIRLALITWTVTE